MWTMEAEMIRDLEIEVRNDREREALERLLGVHLGEDSVVRIPAREHVRLRERIAALLEQERAATI